MFVPFEKNYDRESDELNFLSLIDSYLSNTDSSLSTFANATALLSWYLEDVSWVGFYLDNGDKLILGPFQGNPACTEIAYEKGVCGKSFTSNNIQRVGDVSSFKGHIACDSNTKSEIVLPLIKDGICFAVLDIDSVSLNRFSEKDENFLEECVKIIVEKINFE